LRIDETPEAVTDREPQTDAVRFTCSNGHQNSERQRFCGQCGVRISAPGAAPDGVRRTSANANQAQPSPPSVHYQQPVNALPAWQSQSATPATGFKGSSVPRWVIIAVIAVIVVVVAFLVADKPWESQQYKDCVSANQSQVNGTTVTQAGVEGYCHQLYG
jgi:hypothetical protein